MAVALVLPAMHALTHDTIVNPQNDDTSDLQITTSSIDCSICDFHFSAAQQIETQTYTLFISQKETVYSRSLAQTVHLFPNTLFSLRAPPVAVFS